MKKDFVSWKVIFKQRDHDTTLFLLDIIYQEADNPKSLASFTDTYIRLLKLCKRLTRAQGL